MSELNGKDKVGHGPPYAVLGTQFSIVPQSAVLEMLEKNAQLQSKGNLTLGPLFRQVADNFRDWAKDSEPGCLFQAPEVKLIVIRLSTFAPIATCLSEEARKQAEAAKPPLSDRLKIALE